MSELQTSQLIKIILGVLVIVAVVVGLSILFKDKVFGFFKGLPTGEPIEIFRSLI
ncbi:MAG: hypothetical protein U9Q99_03380 [Nanoarchaeota archaeon]|nr:hypothetical protein [Nanoarchaeota archaeon]